MKFTPIYALGGLFVIGVVGAGAWLLQATNEDLAPPPVAATGPTQAAKAPVPVPAAPKDERFVIKRILPITGPIKYGEWHWDDKGVPDGPLVITVDLDARVLSIFKGGYEIGAAAVLLGTSEKPTPTGVFPIRWKDKDHYSSTYDNAPMPYTMNLTEELAKEMGYERMFKNNEALLERFFGPCESLMCYDTLQFDDYSKYAARKFDEKAKRKRHEEIFPKDCERAFELGVRLVKINRNVNGRRRCQHQSHKQRP